ARNDLPPQGKALLATESKVRELEHHKRVVTEKAARDLNDLKALRDRLESVALEVTARVGEEGKLFGSVTTAHIAELLAEKGYKVDRRKIQLGEPLREIGDHVVSIRLQRDLTAKVALKISAES
ncbi:MAG: 50S ribosomal protein L9, partial [Myxococcales bacterium]|nr:50S ribosomal protein L9 [Myxococcales bacterium]